MTDLLERLLAARAELATHAGQPVQRVCSDKALARLVLIEPRSPAEVEACLRGTSGLDFIPRAVSIFENHFNGLSLWHEDRTSERDARVCELYTRGVPIHDISLAEGIHLDQVLGSLRARVEAGGWVPRRGLLDALVLPIEAAERVAAQVLAQGQAAAHEHLPTGAGKHDLELISLVIAIERRWRPARPVFVKNVEATALAAVPAEPPPPPMPWVGSSGWTGEEDKALWEAVLAGRRPASVAEVLGRGVAEVWLRMERLDFGGRGRGIEDDEAPWTPAQDATLWRAVVAGLPMVEVGLLVRRWPEAARRRFQDLELVDANGGRALAHEGTPWTGEQSSRLRTMLERGASAFEMALALERSVSAIVSVLQGETDGALRHEVELEIALAGVSGHSPRFVLEAFADHGGFRSGDHLCRVLGVTAARLPSALASVTEQLRRRVGDSHFQLWTSVGRSGGVVVRPWMLAVLRRALGRRKPPESVPTPTWLLEGPVVANPSEAPLPPTAAEQSAPQPPQPPAASAVDLLLWRRYLAGDPIDAIAADLERTPTEVHERFDLLETIDANGGRPLANAGARWSRQDEDIVADLFYDGANLTTMALAVQRPRAEVARQLDLLDLECEEATSLEARHSELAAALKSVRGAAALRVLRLIAAESPPYDLGALGGSGAREELQAILDEINEELSRVTGVVAFQLLSESEEDGMWSLELSALATLRRALGVQLPLEAIRAPACVAELPWPTSASPLPTEAPLPLQDALATIEDPQQRAVLALFAENIRFESVEELAELMGVEAIDAEQAMEDLMDTLRQALGRDDFCLWEEEDGELVLLEGVREAVEFAAGES